MDRTLISFNVPNLITVPLMAFLGFLLLAVIWQGVKRVAGPSQAAPGDGGTGSPASGGY